MTTEARRSLNGDAKGLSSRAVAHARQALGYILDAHKVRAINPLPEFKHERSGRQRIVCREPNVSAEEAVLGSVELSAVRSVKPGALIDTERANAKKPETKPNGRVIVFVEVKEKRSRQSLCRHTTSVKDFDQPVRF
jgi:hypothetical protein